MKICLCMIVKDEAAVIERCLKSVLPWVNDAVIYDTGSSDDTIKVIERVWYEAGKNPERLHIMQDAWVDYSTNRNKMLTSARILMNADDGLLLMDADDVFVSEDGVAMTVCDALECKFKVGSLQWTRPVIIRAGAPWEYEGVVHEALVWGGEGKPRKLIMWHVEIQCNVDGQYQGAEHFLEYARLLEKKPQDPRSVFYLAQSYQCAGELEKAHEAYMRRVQMEGWEQERYVAWVELGKMTDDPGCYMRAMKEDAGRPEAWYYIAKWYQRMQFTRMAIESAQHGSWCAVDHMIDSRALFLDTTIRDKLTELKIIIIQDRYAAHLIVNTAGAEYSQELLDLAKAYVPPKPTVPMVKTQEG